jgi:hypothetical protein
MVHANPDTPAWSPHVSSQELSETFHGCAGTFAADKLARASELDSLAVRAARKVFPAERTPQPGVDADVRSPYWEPREGCSPRVRGSDVMRRSMLVLAIAACAALATPSTTSARLSDLTAETTQTQPNYTYYYGPYRRHVRRVYRRAYRRAYYGGGYYRPYYRSYYYGPYRRHVRRVYRRAYRRGYY